MKNMPMQQDIQKQQRYVTKTAPKKNLKSLMRLNRFYFALLLCIVSIIGLTNAYAIDAVQYLDSNPSPLQAGEYADITIRFTSAVIPTNTDASSTVSVRIKESPFVLPAETGFQTLPVVFNGNSFSRTFRVYIAENTPQGELKIPIQIETKTATNPVISEYAIYVYVNDKQTVPDLVIGSVKTTPKELLPDSDDNKMQITLHNLGETDAEFVRAKLVFADGNLTPSYSFSTQDSVAKIESGKSETFEFQIDIDKNAKQVNPTRLELEYRARTSQSSSYTSYAKGLQFDTILSNAPYLEIVEFEQLDAFKKGSADNRVKITIENKGNTDAKDVRVRLVPDISYPFVFTLTTQYVAANLKPGEKVDIIFSAEVKDDAQIRDFPIKTRLESLTGESRYTQEDYFTLTPKEVEKMSTTTIGIIAIILILLVSAGIGVYALMKKE
jgi:hypothetical protein